MNLDRGSLLALERALEAIGEAPSPAEVLAELVEESQAAAPRAALFLLRQGRTRGFCCRGYPDAPARRLSAFDLPADALWPGPAPERESAKPDGALGPDFDQGSFDEAVALPLRVGGGAIAFLLLERAREETPFELPFVRSLVLLARLRLELDLARRKAVPAPSGTLRGDAPAREPERPPPVSLPDLRAETGLVPLEESAVSGSDARLHEARRFARLVATDIRLYNEEAVLLGRRQKDLALRLEDQLKRGKESFLRRFSDLGSVGLTLLEEAYVEVLGAGDPKALAR